MEQVESKTRQAGLGSWFDVHKMRKALNERARSPMTNAFSDSEDSITNALLMAIAREQVRKNRTVNRLAKGIQQRGVRFQVPCSKSKLIESEGQQTIRRISRYPTAVMMSIRVIEALRREGAPSTIKGDVDWILTMMEEKQGRPYMEIVEAPAKAYRDAVKTVEEH
jgi:hypothetical protein